uniref:Phospholipid phosphatase-related protein type 3 n=1 Tax=Salarias fasciatus TaxID=181472 RepID=A0A672GGT1_SALFA
MMVPEKPKKLPSVALSLLPCFYFVELPLVASSLLSLYLLEMTDLLQPAALPFRCFDRSLSKPYVSGGEQLVPTLMLLSLVFSGPAASIMLVEGALYCLQLRWQRRRLAPGSCGFNAFLRRTVRFVGVHLFGLCCTALLTDVLQLCTGYPAPFFLTVCKPNYTLAGASCERQRLVSAAICSGTDQHALAAARKTFPSQHATLSAYAAVYVSMYFNSALPDGSKLLKPLLVFAFAVAAAMSGLTQITQHRSHPVDVYVGFLIGAFVAAYLALHAVSNFKSGEAPPPFPAAPLAPPPGRDDPLRALTERGHQSVYSKGPASASASQDEIAAATAAAAALPSPPSLGAGPLRRGAGSPPPSPPSSLKRASVDVELLAPRSPMAKETMLTFGNSLPRATADDDIITARRSVKPVQILDSPAASLFLFKEQNVTNGKTHTGSILCGNPAHKAPYKEKRGGDERIEEYM